MPSRTIYHGEIEYVQMLDEQGRLDESLAAGTLSEDEIAGLYEMMVICREFDESAFKLQRSGRMGTFPQNKGQEAVALGAARALRRGVDFIVPYYREHGALFWHGLPMHQVLQPWMGDERGNIIDKNLAVNPMNVEIGAHTLHAAGIAWAFKLRKEDRAVLCFLGDGATSTGDFHEAMNFASLYKVPCVFCCVNNQWAISVPRTRQTASETLSQKALAYGMPGVQVDGNDVLAVYWATREAVKRARNGEGPTLIEAVTYRLGDHTTADDARRYRDAKQYEQALALDPLIRTRKFLESRGKWDDQRQSALDERAKKIVHDVIEAALKIERPATEDMFRFTYEKLTDELEAQMRTMRTDSIGKEPSQVGLHSTPQHA